MNDATLDKARRAREQLGADIDEHIADLRRMLALHVERESTCALADATRAVGDVLHGIAAFQELTIALDQGDEKSANEMADGILAEAYPPAEGPPT